MGLDYRTYTGLGKQTLGGHKQNQEKTQEKGSMIPQETEPDLPVSVQEFPVEAWIGKGPAAGSGALSAAVGAWDVLKELAIIFITSTIVWSLVKQQGGNTAPPFNRKLN